MPETKISTVSTPKPGQPAETVPAPEPAAAKGDTVKFKIKDAHDYPVVVTVPGAEYTFADADSTIEVPLAEAEHLTFSTTVERV